MRNYNYSFLVILLRGQCLSSMNICAYGEADILFVFHSKDSCLSRIFNKKILLNMLGGLNCRHKEKKTIQLVSLLMLWKFTVACVLDYVLKVERLKSSRSHCFVKARFECLPPDNFLAEVVPCGSLAWATVWVLDFLFDLAHIIMGNIHRTKNQI